MPTNFYIRTQFTKVSSVYYFSNGTQLVHSTVTQRPNYLQSFSPSPLLQTVESQTDYTSHYFHCAKGYIYQIIKETFLEVLHDG